MIVLKILFLSICKSEKKVSELGIYRIAPNALIVRGAQRTGRRLIKLNQKLENCLNI